MWGEVATEWGARVGSSTRASPIPWLDCAQDKN